MKDDLRGLICPICKKSLAKFGKVLKCQDNHSFDIARQGYCNMLLSDKKHSSLPGDNQIMVQSRFDFLSKGYYFKLSQSICAQIDKNFVGSANILDAGCGYGYYCNNIYYNKQNDLTDKNNENINNATESKDYNLKKNSAMEKFYISGVDISKFAIAKASGINKEINYYVASVFDLPFKDNCFDCILSVFSPFAMQEYGRVLKSDGILIVVSPAPKHLWELKEILYENCAEEKAKVGQWQSWTQVDKQRLTYKITLDCNKDILNLFAMTPYFYTTSQDKKEKLNQVDNGVFTLDFFITVLKKEFKQIN